MTAVVKRAFDLAFGQTVAADAPSLSPLRAHYAPYTPSFSSPLQHQHQPQHLQHQEIFPANDDANDNDTDAADADDGDDDDDDDDDEERSPQMGVPKRSRRVEQLDERASPTHAHAATTVRGNSPFRAVGRRAIDGFEAELPRKLRRKLNGSDRDGVGAEITLSMPEVRQLVQCALDIQERRLRIEYDEVLQTQLREQFESFTRFNREHLSRIVSEREFSYCG